MKYIIIIFILMGWSNITVAQDTAKDSTKSEAEQYFSPLKWRNIGPFRGGRSVCATGVPGDPLTYYMGTTGGGLWKTEDAGQQWKNISDGYFKTGSVGAIAVAKSNPNILYCGMGEHAPRGVMTSHGDGVYKSIDAGKTWKHIGLVPTQHISRIIINPENPDIVFVAAQGALYGPSKERGIYKSIDGGSTWRNVLFVNELTGCSELTIDPKLPHIMYATMWEHQRKPWKVISGGEGSGVYKSTDSGETWFKIEIGLPNELGKMAITICPSNTNKLYALIESDTEKDLGGLFVTNNAGESWTRISDDNRLTQRAWYYIEVFADPTDENTVYVMSAPALRSLDGGKTWARITGTHGDFHDLWINPDNPKNLCIANDGGAAISFNFGKSWSRQDNMPTSQFYRVNVDNHFPYRIYGGQQDNSSVRIESRALGGRGIDQGNWTASAGGESAFLAFDPDNPTHVIGGSYQGTIEVLHTEAKAGTKIMAAPNEYLGEDAKDIKYRYNWNAPIIWSQHEPNTYYHGAQVLLKTQDLGISWIEASPDLTNNEIEKQGKGGGPYTNEAVGAENYGTLSYVVESPHEKGVIYTGSDDGVVQVTRDNCKSWSVITPKGLAECLINAIEVSPHNPGTIYIATTRYKFNDHTPGLYKSTNYGKSWTNISSNLPSRAFTRVVREDPETEGLLIAGTELGIYASWDDGQEWQSLQLNLPLCPITDLILKHDDIVAATSGRAFWILDDLGSIRQYKKSTTSFKLLDPEDAYYINGSSELNSSKSTVTGSHPFRGVNPANGIVLYYELPELKENENITIEIKDQLGHIVNSFSSLKDSTFVKYDGGPSAAPILTKSKGLNRFVWNMNHRSMNGITKAYIEANYNGHKAIPGDYNITLIVGDKKASVKATILANPLYPTNSSAFMEYDKFMTSMEDEVITMHNLVNHNYKTQKQLSAILKNVKITSKNKELMSSGIALLSRMQSWDDKMIQRKSKAYDDVENFRNKFTANYLFMVSQTNSAIPRVNNPNRERRTELEAQWKILKEEGEAIKSTAVPNFNKALWKQGIGALWTE